MKVLSVRLNDTEAAALDALCEQSRVTRSELVRRLIVKLAFTQTGPLRSADLARELAEALG